MSNVEAGNESIILRYIASNWPKVRCYLVNDLTLRSRLNNQKTVEADVYVPGQLMVQETMFHDFGHMTDFMLRGLSWRISKKDFGWQLYRPKVWNEKSDVMSRMERAENRAVCIEYMLVREFGFQDENEEEFIDNIGSKVRFAANRLMGSETEFRKNKPFDNDIVLCDEALKYSLSVYKDITMDTVMPAFAKAVDIFNAAAVDPALRKTVLFKH